MNKYISQETKMIFQVTSVYRRPNEDVKWHGMFVLDSNIEEQKNIFTITNYHGKYEILSEFPDANTLVVKTKWESEEAYNRYREEPCIQQYFALVEQYFQIVGITSDPKTKEYIEGSFN